MTDFRPTATPPPDDPAADLPPDLAAVETLLLAQSAAWQPPAGLRAAILAGRRPSTAPQARIARQTRRWWNACAAAVLLLAGLHLTLLGDLPTPDFGGLAPTHAPLARDDGSHPAGTAPQDGMAALSRDPAFRAQLLAPALRLVPAIDPDQFKRWTELETPGVGS